MELYDNKFIIKMQKRNSVIKNNTLGGRTKSSKSMVFVSDIHNGSIYAVCTPEPDLGAKGSHKPNRLQKVLYDTWVDCIDRLHQRPRALVLNGEPMDGGNKKQQGDTSWTNNINLQIADSAKLISMYSYDYLLMTRGSGYHVHRDATNDEENVADKLNAVPYSAYFDKLYTGRGVTRTIDQVVEEYKGKSVERTDYQMWLRMNDKLFSITHHIGFSRWFAYRTTPLAREMADLTFAAGKLYPRDEPPAVIVRSHVHYHVMVRFASSLGFTTPAWKFPDPHLLRGGLGGTSPTIGTVEVIVEPNGEILVYPHVLETKFYPKPMVIEL